MFDHLLQLANKIDSQSAIEFFRSKEARQPKSMARSVVESGIKGIRDLSDEFIPKLIFASILLGGSTLDKYYMII